MASFVQKACEKDVVGIVTFVPDWFTYHQSHYCLHYNGILRFLRKRSMLKVKQLKQRKIFEISLTESQIYKTLQTSAIIREISDSNLETEVLTDLTEKSGWGCRKHNGKRFSSLPRNCHIRYSLNPKMGRICVARVWNREGTEKLVNGKQHSVWFVPTRINGLPQNVLLNFRLEFPKSNLTIYLPSVNSEIFCQTVSTSRIDGVLSRYFQF